MNDIDKLIRVVPPVQKPKNTGSLATWHCVKKQVDLPDWLFPFFHAYGSGEFAVIDSHESVVDSIRLMNVFETPLLKYHKLDGQGFVEENKLSKLPVHFFPETRNGLFPITRSDQGKFLLIDPKNERKVYITANHLAFFFEFDSNLIDFLYRAFTGEKNLHFIAMEKGESISKVRFVKNWKDAYKV